MRRKCKACGGKGWIETDGFKPHYLERALEMLREAGHDGCVLSCCSGHLMQAQLKYQTGWHSRKVREVRESLEREKIIRVEPVYHSTGRGGRPSLFWHLINDKNNKAQVSHKKFTFEETLGGLQNPSPPHL